MAENSRNIISHSYLFILCGQANSYFLYYPQKFYLSG